MSKVFPKTLTWPGTEARVTLFADGSFSGTPAVVELYMTSLVTSATPMGTASLTAISLWLLVRSMQNDLGIERRTR